MNNYLGIDTSNYTTSIALYNGEKIIHQKRLLKVKDGFLGLRQSDAVFQHINQLPDLFFSLFKNKIDKIIAVGVSKSPRDENGSYMPCFTVGLSVAKIISNILQIPMFTFSHQVNHIISALYSANKLDILNQKFLAFHVSGGTTEVLLVEPDDEKVINCKVVSKTLDLNAGQAVDRVGIMLGLNFPAGAELEKLALGYNKKLNTGPCIKGHDFCISGLENICKKMYNDNESYSKIARYCIDYIGDTIDIICEKLINEYGNIPIVFSGGVMSNSIINKRFVDKYNAFFAKPEFSSDNAAGLAILASIKEETI